MASVRRLGSLAILFALAAVSASAAFGMSPPIVFRPIAGPVGAVNANQNGVTVTVSNHRAGAKPVTVTLRYTGPLRCGHPGSATVVLPAPSALRRRLAVVVNGKAGTAVKVGHSLKVTGPTSKVMCDSIVDRPDHASGRGSDEPRSRRHLRAARRNRRLESCRHVLAFSS